MTHKQFLSDRLTRKVKEIGHKYECIAWSKLYSKEVLGITLGAFGGMAKKATYKKGGTFDPDKFIQFTPGPGKDMKQGDIVVFSTLKGNKEGHTGVVERANSTGFYLSEQNAATGQGSGEGNDAILVNYYLGWQNVLNFYRKKSI